MGHYDSCYEADNAARLKKHTEEINNNFADLCNTLKADQKDFLLLIAKDIDDWITFVKVIKKLK